MGRRKQQDQARKACASLGHQSIENRHEKIKRELREKLVSKIAELEEERVVKEAMMKEMEDLKLENVRLDSELKEKAEAVHFLNEEVSWLRRKLSEIEKSTDFVTSQVSVLRRENVELKEDKEHMQQELESREKSQMNTIKAVVETESKVLGLVHRKQYEELEKKLPNWRTINFRCKKALDSLKKTVGEENFDDFLTDLCHFIARDPQYSFKLCLSAIDSFFATVKWNFSDGFLRDFKAFLTKKLKFDLFASRPKIDALRKEHSGSDTYRISVSSVLKKLGSRDVETESAVIEVSDLSKLLSRRLERLHEDGLLHFDDVDSPVIIGVGGDKGGEHTKLVVVIGNVEHPNNPHGILLIGMYEGHDDYKNLQKYMSAVFEQVNSLEKIQYKENGQTVERDVLKIIIGDCKYLSAVIGHGGQSLSTPCFLCKLTWSYRGARAARVGNFDFSKIGAPYQSTDLKPPLLHIHSSAISPPPLHITLGLVQTYILDWFFALSNKLDFGEELPDDLKKQKKVLKNLQDQEEYYGSRYRRFQKARETIEAMIQILDNSITSGTFNTKGSACDSKFCFIASSKKQFSSNSEMFRCEGCDSCVHELCSLAVTPEDVEKLKNQSGRCFECRKKSADSLEGRKQYILKSKKIVDKQVESDEDVLSDVTSEREKLEEILNKSSGPTRRRLEDVLRSIRCDFRAFYQQLTGNQARKLLRPENIEKLLQVFPEDSSDKLVHMKEVMLTLGELMSSANNEMKRDDEIEEIRSLLTRFEHFLRLAQPDSTVTPKLHLLCAHLVPYLELQRSWGHLTEKLRKQFQLE
ncbi:hypothetical protein B9Z55_015344 [Caenorhabditis nigoni]|nr:hypothetical protein B9Z55_015344 [Caenorhabditis nigoni]